MGSKIRLWDDGTDTATYGFGIGSAALNYHIDHNPNGAHRFMAGGSNGDGTELMRIQSNGNVGIGNGGPLSPLSFASITGPKIALYDNGSATEHYGIGVSGGQLNYHTMTGGSHMFYTGGKNGDGTELMRIQGDGNVGIGTIAPTAKLHVNGTARIQGSVGTPTTITGRDANGNIGDITLGSNLNLSGGVLSATVPAAGWSLTGNGGTNPANNFIGTTNAQPLAFRTNNDEKMRIANNGFVGIGTTSPGGRLYMVSDGLGGGSTDDIVLASYGPTATSVLPTFFFQAGTGTAASPGNTANNTTMGSVQFNAFVGGALATQSAITSNYTGNGLTHGANLTFLTRQAGDASFVQQMIITPAGSVGIGTMTPSYDLDVLGDINASVNVRAGGVVLTSDARLKRNINETKHGLSTIMALNPVEYEKKNSIKDNDYNRHEIGFIAQEVAKVLPNLVTEGKDADKTLAVSYTELIPVLTKAIQELNTQVETLKAENQELKESKVATTQLMERVKQMEQMMGIKEIEAGAKVAGK